MSGLMPSLMLCMTPVCLPELLASVAKVVSAAIWMHQSGCTSLPSLPLRHGSMLIHKPQPGRINVLQTLQKSVLMMIEQAARLAGFDDCKLL